MRENWKGEYTMSKHKNFHSSGGKGGLVRQMAFFYRSRPGGTRNGYPRIEKNTAPSAANTESGKAEQNLTGTVSASDGTRE